MTVLMCLVTSSMILTAAGCADDYQVSINTDDIRTFLIHMDFAFDVKYDFGTKTITAIYHGETVEEKLGASDTVLYEQAIKRMCADAVAHSEEFYGHPGEMTFAQWWYMEMGLADGTVQPAAATSEGSRAYPDGWDDFAAMTERLTGVPIGAEADAIIPDSYRR